MSYVPPHIRNKSTSVEAPTERKNPFHRDRRSRDRGHHKPQWEIEKEKQAADAADKIKEQERGMEHTEANFPVLGSSVSNFRAWSGRKFTEMASDWKETDDREKEILEEKPADDYTFVLPKFRSIRRFAEPEEEAEESHDKPADDEWQVVQRKQRKAKRDLTEEEMDAKFGLLDENVTEDTVWGVPEEHQTCWDERRG
jgi:hypothetical protein